MEPFKWDETSVCLKCLTVVVTFPAKVRKLFERVEERMR